MKNDVNRALVAKKKFCKNSLTLLAGLLLTFAFPSQGWASSSTTYYYAQLKAVTKDKAKGLVYADGSLDANPSWTDSKETDKKSTQNKGENQTFYAWAQPKRGYDFAGWDPNTGVDGEENPYKVTVKASSSSEGTNTVTISATWKTYEPCTVHLHSSSEGSYNINYKYAKFDNGKLIDDSQDISITSNITDKDVELYKTDAVTLNVNGGEFEGWYSDAGFNNPISDAVIIGSGSSYTLNVPDGGTLEIYPKFKSQPKLYGKLNVAFALGSAADGGQIAVTDIKDAAPGYSSDPLSLSHTSFVSEGTKSIQQEYYLNAKSNIDVQYAFVGWFSSQIPSSTTLISMDAEYTYSFDVSSTDESHPTEQTIYAMFVRINMHYFEMTAEPQTPGLGMVLIAQNNEQTPGYDAYSNYSQVLAEEIELANRAVETNFYLYAAPKYGYQFDGWYSDAACTNILSADNPYTYAASANSTDPNNPDKAHVYAKFKIATPFNVTFEKPTTQGNYAASIRDIVASEGEYIWGEIEIFNSANESSNKTLSMFPTSNLVLKATADDGNSIKSWKIGSSTVTTGASVYTTSATATTTFGATFGASSPFKVGSTTYSTLAAAIANLGTNKQITVVEDATVAPGTYIIPKGVTLLIPNSTSTDVPTKPAEVTEWTTLSRYRTLTLIEGVNLTINGTLCVSATQFGGSNGTPGPGSVSGAYGCIDMSQGGHITIANGAQLNAFGFIFGSGNQSTSGTITIQNGGQVSEFIVIQDMHGGGGSAATVNGEKAKNDYDLFPFHQYYIQNIEPKMTIEYGGTEYVYYDVSASGMGKHDKCGLIGSTTSVLFQLSSGAKITKWYDAIVDRQCYELLGTVGINEMSIYVSDDIGLISTKYVLPITNNMQINILSGSTANIPNKMKMLPGSKIVVAEGGTVNLTNELFAYDCDDWDNYAMGSLIIPMNDGGSKINAPSVTYYRNRKNHTKGKADITKADLTNAVLEINGTLNISAKGALYTTSTGSSIVSTGSGKIVYDVAAMTSNKNLYEIYGAYGKSTTGALSQDAAYNGTDVAPDQVKVGSYILMVIKKYACYGTPVVSTPAQLRNGNGTYVQTAGAAANTTYTYFLGEWKKNLTIDGCFAVDDAGHKYISTEKGYKDVIDSEIYTAAWVSRDATSVLYIHTADNCDWLEVHTMTDNTTYLQDAEGNIYEYSSSNGYWVPATQYTATFKNFNDKVLYTTKVLPNGTPVYAGPTPIRTADDAGEYTFTGWNPAIGAINADTYYIAQYARTSNVVSVSVTGSTFYFTTWTAALDFANSLTSNPTIKLLDNISDLTANQTITKSMTIDLNGHELAGSAPLFKVNASDANVTLTSSVVGGKLNATQVATETNGNFWITGGYFNALEAQLTPFVQDPYAVLPLTGVEGYSYLVGIAYTITFVDGDGNTIQSSKWAQGATPSYSGATPTKAEDAEYTYSFKGWDKEIVSVTEDATYTATFTQTKKSYTLTWNLDGGTITTAGTTAGSVEWGTFLTAPVVEKTGYTFAGWDKEIPATMPAEDATYMAQWEAQQEVTYTVNHYYESALGVKEDTPFRTDEGHGLIGEQVSADDVLKLEGYDSPDPSTETITEGLVVKYYYKSRNLNVAKEVVIAGADLDQIVVENAGTLSASTPSTTQRLVLTATPGNNDGANADLTNITIKESVCIEIVMNSTGTMDDKLYYCFSVPFNVNVDDGVKRLNETNGNWESAVLNKNYLVYTYSESDRAAKGPQDSNWTLFKGTQFAPGVFYLCEFDNSNYNRYRFYAADKTALNNKGDIDVSNTNTGDATNGGWNGVANNGLTDNQLSGDNIKFIQILNSKGNSFEAFDTNSKPLAIGNAAMVQVNATGSVLVGKTSSAVAARRMGETASTEFINVRLYKENQDKHVDQIFIRASEDAAEQYVAGIDLSKATMGTPKVARLWVNDYDLQLVANEALMTNDQATFSLGMSAPANGEYTIAIDDTPNDAIVYLTMDGSAIWNLNIAPAPISLSKGTENSYGLRLVHKINNVVTGFDEAVLNGNVQKVILNDHLYIIREGKVYSAHGHAIK